MGVQDLRVATWGRVRSLMPGRTVPWARGFLPAAGLVVALQVVLATITGWSPVTGEFWGPDSYMRLARTLTCAGGSACPQGVFPGTNAPYGEVIHWPFLQDRLLLVLAAPLAPLLGRHDAVLVAASLFGPLLAVSSVALILLAGRTLVPRPGLYFVGILLACQPWFFQAFAAPQADHHGLQGLLFLGMVAGVLHVLADTRIRRWSMMTGAFLGAALWVSTEALVSCLPLLLGLAAFWLVRGGRAVARANRDVALAALAVLTVGLLIDGPSGEALAVEYDRFSIVHWTVFALLTGLWWAFERLEDGGEARLGARLALAFGGAVALAGTIAILFPRFFGGPMVGMDARLASIWLARTSEFVPVAGHPRALVVSLHLASSLLAIPAAVVCAAWGERPVRGRWRLLLGACLWFAGMALFLHGRWALYLHLLVPIPLAWLLGKLVTAVARARLALLRPAAHAGSVIVFALFPLVFALPLARAEAVGSGAQTSTGTPTSCSASPLVPFLKELENRRGAGTLLAPADWGPEIAFRTGHRVVASPYHRNAAGLLDSHAFMAATDEGVARRIADRRGIDWVLVCNTHDWFPVVDGSGPGSLHAALTTGGGPSWLRTVSLPESLAGTFHVYEVVAGQQAATP